MPTKSPSTAAAELERSRVAAEIEKIQAERDFHLENAAVAHTLNSQEEIALRLRQRAEQRELSQDQYHKVYVFDEVVDENSVKTCVQQLTTWSRTDPGCDVEIQLNSEGGSIFAGLALVDFIRGLRKQGHHVTIVVYGIAASMGGVILQAADVRVMGQNAFMLIHEGSMVTMGDFGSIEDDMKLYNKLHQRILNLLSERSNLTTTQIKKSWKRTNWWLDADECLADGFVDELR